MDKIKEKNIPFEIRDELDIKPISEVLPKTEPLYPELEQADVEQLINIPIVIRKVNFLPSTFGEDKEFVIAKISVNKQEKKLINGSKVIIEKLKKIENKLPVSCKIISKKSEAGRKYYDLE